MESVSMKLENRILALIAVGASVSANCQPCLERNVSTALKCGADVQEIAEVIEIGQRVRGGAASKMDAYIPNLVQSNPIPANPAECGCGL